MLFRTLRVTIIGVGRHNIPPHLSLKNGNDKYHWEIFGLNPLIMSECLFFLYFHYICHLSACPFKNKSNVFSPSKTLKINF